MRTEDGEYLLTPERFIAGLKKSHAYYWPASESGGASGNYNNVPTDDLFERMKEAADANDQPLYRRLKKQYMDRQSK